MTSDLPWRERRLRAEIEKLRRRVRALEARYRGASDTTMRRGL